MKTSFHFYSYLDDFALRVCASSSLADVAQLVEHHHGKVGVASSILAIGSKNLFKISRYPGHHFLFLSEK